MVDFKKGPNTFKNMEKKLQMRRDGGVDYMHKNTPGSDYGYRNSGIEEDMAYVKEGMYQAYLGGNVPEEYETSDRKKRRYSQ